MPKNSKNHFKPEDQEDILTTFAVDESGDPTFYDSKGNLIVGNLGCSPILIMGCIYTTNPKDLRKIVELSKNEVLDDPLILIKDYRRKNFAFHAKEDAPEVKKIFFKNLKGADFKAKFVVARKIESTFKVKHKSNETIFYDDMISQLFRNILYKSTFNHIYFSKRGSRLRQDPLQSAIKKSIKLFESKHKLNIKDENTTFQVQVPTDEPLLQIVDYLNWAVYRAFTKRTEAACVYLNFLEDKVKLIWDIYDYQNQVKMQNLYNSKTNPFDHKKITPLGLDSEK
jgi:Protein of unknown function (DUF3800)